eukprot:357652-Chlamydomonas_euryale.AAC.2
MAPTDCRAVHPREIFHAPVTLSHFSRSTRPSPATDLANEQSKTCREKQSSSRYVPHPLKGPSTDHQLQRARAILFKYSLKPVAVRFTPNNAAETVGMSDL